MVRLKALAPIQPAYRAMQASVAGFPKLPVSGPDEAALLSRRKLRDNGLGQALKPQRCVAAWLVSIVLNRSNAIQYDRDIRSVNFPPDLRDW